MMQKPAKRAAFGAGLAAGAAALALLPAWAAPLAAAPRLPVSGSILLAKRGESPPAAEEPSLRPDDEEGDEGELPRRPRAPSEDGTEIVPGAPEQDDTPGCPFRNQPLELLV